VGRLRSEAQEGQALYDAARAAAPTAVPQHNWCGREKGEGGGKAGEDLGPLKPHRKHATLVHRTVACCLVCVHVLLRGAGG
jgi:hypothetical protein